LLVEAAHVTVRSLPEWRSEYVHPDDAAGTENGYAKLARQHIARTGSTAREMWKLLDQPRVLEATTTCDTANILSDVRV
jgi:hypothetical protein